MTKKLLIILLTLIPTLVFGQTYINQGFTGTFPPTGWVADSYATHWHASANNNAGGTAPEAVFDWSPQFTGTTRFMSPRINLTGVTALKVQFRQMIDHYATPYTVGVATRHGAGAWTVVWQLSPTASVPAQVITRDITNGDVGASDFQICWFFTGNSLNINYWYIDDILLFTPLAHDIKVASVETDPQYEQGDDLAPTATIQNFGLNTETFDARCQIMVGQTSVYDNVVTGINMSAGQSMPVEFPSFIIPTANELYHVIVISQLTGDMNNANDTAYAWFNTYTTPRDMVVLEIGTGTWCQYCPGAAMGADDMISHGHNVAVVEYHSGGGGDPFINTFSDARVQYYGISGFPTAFFDGVLSYVGGSHTQSNYTAYLPLFQQRAPIKSAFTIELFGDHTGTNYHIQARITKHARIPYENMVFHLAVTESNIAYSWQGQTHIEHAERLMSPDQNGTIINFSTGDVQIVNLNFTLSTAWVVNNCEIEAFIQNLDNKEILQGTKSMIAALAPTGIDDNTATLPVETKLTGNYPNPFNPSTQIAFSLKESGNVKVEIFNLLGQKIITLIDARVNAGEHSVIWNGRDFNGHQAASGAYFYKLTTDKYESTKKMVLLK